MSNKNLDLNDIDDYINTFKLKNFDESEDEESEENIFSNENERTEEESPTNLKKGNLEIEKPFLIVSEKEIPQAKSLNEFKTEAETSDIKHIEHNNEAKETQSLNIIKPERSIFDLEYKEEEENNEDLFSIKTNKSKPSDKALKDKEVNNQINSNTKADDKNNKDTFSKIYDNFSDVFKTKVEIPSRDFLEKEIHKLEGYHLSDKNIEVKSNCVNISDNHKNKENNLSNSIVLKVEETSNDHDIIKELKIDENFLSSTDRKENENRNSNSSPTKISQVENLLVSTNLASSFSQTQDVSKVKNNSIIKIKAYFDKTKLIHLHSSRTNQFNILDLNKHLGDLSHLIEKKYFPISYSDKFKTDEFKNIFLNLKTKMIKREIPNVQAIDFILVSLFHSFLEGNMKTFILTDVNYRQEFIKNLKPLMKTEGVRIEEIFFKHSEFIFPNRAENFRINCNLENIFNNGVEKLISDCYKDKNISNFIFLSLFGKQEDVFNYLLETFKENPEQKQTEFYIFFMIRSGHITQLISEQSNYLFQNFYNVLIVLLENLDYFYDVNVLLFLEMMLKKDSINKTFDKFIVLKLITNNLSIDMTKHYADSLTNYLHFNNYFRLLISDVFNYLVFTKASDADKVKLSSVGYCSILIKFKYLLLKIQSNSFDERMKDYGDKIVENIRQLGKYSQNENFLNYLKDLLSPAAEEKVFSKIEKNIKKEKDDVISSSISQLNVVKEVAQPDTIKSKEAGLNKNQEKVGGFTSFIVSALGLGSNTKKDEKVEEVKKDEEVVPEIYYDPVKKRWVLKGKIYDDGEEVKDETNQNLTAQKLLINNPNNIFDNSTNSNSQSTGQTTTSKPLILPPKVKINKPSIHNITEQSINKPQTITVVPEIKKDTTSSNNIHSTNTLPPSKSNVISNPFLTKKDNNSATSNTSNIRAPPKINLSNRYASLLDQNK